MDAAEFQRLVEAANARRSPARTAPPAVVAAARYEAKWLGERLVGKAALEVILAGPAPAVLPLEPCNLAVGKASWRTADTREAKPPEPVALGADGDGKLQAVVDRSGRLGFEWSLAPRRDLDGGVSFSFELPPTAAAELLLELPKRFVPAIDRGLILGGEPAGAGVNRWRIELGGQNRFRLHLASAGVPHRRQLVLLRESRTYDCSLRGVEVAAQWKLEIHNEPLERIVVLLDPELQLVSARYGDSPILWSAGPAAAGGPTRITLRFPEAIPQGEHVIRLGALGRPVLDRAWRLPRIRPEGLAWQEGNIALLVSEPLRANRVVPLECGQTGAGPLSAPRAGQSMQFQSFGADATVEVLLSPRPAQAQTPDDVPLLGTSSAKREPVAKHCLRQAVETISGWVWNGRLESWYQADGASRHIATYELQHTGCKGLRLTLPRGIAPDNLRGVWLDGDPAAWRLLDTDQDRCVSVELPADRKFPRVTVEWTAGGPRLGVAGRLTARLPEPNLPVLSRRWTVYLPPGYEPWDRLAICPADGSEGAPGWTVWQTDLPAATPASLGFVRGTSMPLLGALVFLMVVAQTFISVGQTFLSTKRKGKSEADRNVCPTGHRGYAIFAVLLGIFGAAAIVLPAVCLPIALGGLLGVLFGLVWQWTGHSASAQAGPQTAAKPSSPGSTSTIAARLGLVLFVASLLLFGCRAAEGAESRRDCGRGGPRCRRRRRAALFRISRVHTDRRPAEANRRKGLPARGVLSTRHIAARHLPKSCRPG